MSKRVYPVTGPKGPVQRRVRALVNGGTMFDGLTWNEFGGYYVVYEDGYKSFSPAGAFESGYTLL